MKLVMEMETGDPDDFLTLLVALDHPDIDLKAVVLNPGSPEQVGLVRWALDRFGRQDVAVGSLDLDNKNNRSNPAVSAWHHKVVDWIESREAQEGWRALQESLDGETIMFVGAPMRNLGKLLQRDAGNTQMKRMVIQGGFAGDSIVPPEYRLPKFEGRETCATFNLNGHPKSTERTINKLIDDNTPTQFVSKNVCHGILYDPEFHAALEQHKEKRQSLQLIHEFMDKTYIKQDKVKALHDPFALCCAIDETIAQWEEVEMYRIKGEWGCVGEQGSNIRITIAGDKNKFFDVLMRQ